MKNIDDLKAELSTVESKIKKLEVSDSYLDSVNKSFHLGMVGGSGRNNHKLNKRREQSLDRTIKNASILVPLYQQRDLLKHQIEEIESGQAQKKEDLKVQRAIKSAEFWKRLRVGDELPIGNPSGNPIIAKKNKSSVITTSGCKWSVQEIIGKEAMQYL